MLILLSKMETSCFYIKGAVIDQAILSDVSLESIVSVCDG